MSIEVRRPVAGTLTVRTAAHIRAVMAYYGTTQREVARKIGVNDQWMSVRMRGTQPIDLNDLEKIADALGVDPVDLMPRGVTAAYPPHGVGGPGAGPSR